MTLDRRSLAIAALVLLLGAAGVAAWLWAAGGGQQRSLLRPDDAAVVALGQAVYGEHCAACHGTKLEGQPNWHERRADGRLPAPPHDENGHTWHHPAEVLVEMTKRGPAAMVGGSYESDMPGYAEILEDEEIVAVLSYIKSTWPARIRAYHDQFDEAPR